MTAGDEKFRVALAHDYITQRGGAERVALMFARTFTDAPVTTLLYNPDSTYEEFRSVRIQTSAIDKLPRLRQNHRLALPLLAPAASRVRLDADVCLISSSGWAHGMQSTGHKVVYCHAPARWLYQESRYLGEANGRLQDRLKTFFARATLRLLKYYLKRWDRRAAHSATKYLANSTVTKDAIKDAYGIDAEVLPPPPGLQANGVREALNIEPGFLLCVSRLLPYKNLDVVLDAAGLDSTARVVIVGDGPEWDRLSRMASALDGRVTMLRRLSDAHMRWLYANCSALVAISYEDYGLTPLEAAMMGKPSIALRAGGYLDTVVEDLTGIFVDEPVAPALVAAMRHTRGRQWDSKKIRAHAEKFSEDAFATRLREIVRDLAQSAATRGL